MNPWRKKKLGCSPSQMVSFNFSKVWRVDNDFWTVNAYHLTPMNSLKCYCYWLMDNFIYKASVEMANIISHDTVDGRNPAPPGMYKTLWFLGYLLHQLVQDFFHQQYLMISRILACLAAIPKQWGWKALHCWSKSRNSRRIFSRNQIIQEFWRYLKCDHHYVGSKFSAP